jgi:C-terminal processing protease CtpA/Prc
MSVIRSKVADNHFTFSIRGGQKDESGGMPSHERSPHGLRTARKLENGTAYLEFDGLPGDSASMAVVGQALAEQPVTQAVILDLRDNNGGSGDMVVLICSHLLDPNVLLCTFSDRSDRAPMEIKTSAHARHFGTTIPVFVLTSEHTLSAAEALAYILQDYGRAVVVGEQTAGMANPSRTYHIGERFELTVPFLLTRYGKSGRTFAGIGVEPDIEVSAESALEVALEEVRKLQESPDP